MDTYADANRDAFGKCCITVAMGRSVDINACPAGRSFNTNMREQDAANVVLTMTIRSPDIWERLSAVRKKLRKHNHITSPIQFKSK